MITWSTFDLCDTLAKFWPVNDPSLRSTISGSSHVFIDGGPLKRSQFIHRVTLPGTLAKSTRYNYTVGSDKGWSPVHNFVVPSTEANLPISVAIFGDMGTENAQSLPYLQKDVDQDLYDALIHVGDFAYDMDSQNGLIGDQFMRQIESIAGYVPYMVCVGNHEEQYNFSNYRNRFSMPGDSENLWYSFDLGPVHFISINTEVYYFLNYGIKNIVKQYQWLEEDLKRAVANRENRPWIVIFGHRPMYCSNHNDADCNNNEAIIRVGLPLTHFFGLENLFYEHGVDLLIWAHEHSVERLLPIYDFKILNGSIAQPYTNPKAPVHLITGSAGCNEGKTDFVGERPPWSAFHSSDYGYTKMKAFNKTHLYFEQISVDQEGQVIDSYWIIKDKHGKFE